MNSYRITAGAIQAIKADLEEARTTKDVWIRDNALNHIEMILDGLTELAMPYRERLVQPDKSKFPTAATYGSPEE